MRLKKEYVTGAAANKRIMVGAQGGAFREIARSDETAAFIIERLKRDTTPETIIAELYAERDAPIGVIAADMERTLNILRDMGALEE